MDTVNGSQQGTLGSRHVPTWMRVTMPIICVDFPVVGELARRDKAKAFQPATSRRHGLVGHAHKSLMVE
jgi:hypothetical protein